MTVTEDHIKKLLELEAKATAGSWRPVQNEIHDQPQGPQGYIVRCRDYLQGPRIGIDATFIAESRNIFRELAEDWLRMKQKEI